jgi:ribonuclease HI
MMDRHVVVYADGSIQPDRSGAGVIVTDGRGRILAAANRQLPVMTNNEAEYAGLMMALQLAAEMKARTVEVRLDSEVVTYQMAGHFSVNSPKLKTMHQQACMLARGFAEVTFTHIPRERNALADALATEASAGRAWSTEK